MSGNYDGGSYVTHFLDSPITLYNTDRMFKFFPKLWHVKPCMRFELIACGKLYIVIARCSWYRVTYRFTMAVKINAFFN